MQPTLRTRRCCCRLACGCFTSASCWYGSQKGCAGRQAVYVSSIAFLVVLSVWAANLLSSVHRFAAP